MNTDISITHNSGFFSCCSVALEEICVYYNTYKKFPTVDRSNQFYWYKESRDQDLSSIVFSKESLLLAAPDFLQFDWHSQFDIYKELNFDTLTPVVYNYFKPSKLITDRVDELICDVNEKFDNIISVCYRGNDKSSETIIASYTTFIEKVKEICKNSENPLFYLQTDEQEFADTFVKVFPNTYINKKIRMMKKDITRAIQHVIPNFTKEKFEFACNFLASMIFMSKTKTVVTHSGNVGVWLALYRTNCDNLHQYLNGEWY